MNTLGISTTSPTSPTSPTSTTSTTPTTSTARDVLVVFAISLLVTVPLVVVHFPMGQDLPAHIETAAQILALWRDDDVVGARYLLHQLPWPNALPTMVLAALMTVMDALPAARLLTGVGLALWPTSLALLCARLGRAPLWALLALPTTYDLAFAYGFFHFVVGKPLWTLVIAHAAHAARTDRRGPYVLLALLLPLLFCTHLLLGLSAAALAVIVVLVLADSWRRRWAGLVACLVGTLPALWWMQSQPPTPAGTAVMLPLDQAVDRLWANLGDLAADSSDALPWQVAGVIIVVAVVVMVVRPEPRRRWLTRDSLLLVLLGTLTLLFALLGPIRTAQASVVAERFSSLGVAVLVLLPPVVTSGRRSSRRALMAVGVVIAVLMARGTTARWQAFNDDEMGDFEHLLKQIPTSAVVATHFVRPLSTHGHYNVLWHWPKLVALRGGVTDDSFAFRATCVVGLKFGAQPPRRRPLRTNEAFTLAGLAGFDHLLVQGTEARVDAAVRRGVLTPVTSTGVWQLLRVNHRQP